MELPADDEEPSEFGETPDELSQDFLEELVPVWPPRIAEPPRLAYSEDEYMGLALDPLGKAPEPPDFSRVRLTAQAKESQRPHEKRDLAPTAVVYDRHNPSGRTRGDKVLRPTEEDRIERMWRKRRGAAVTAAFGAGLLTLILTSLPPLYLAGVVLVAALSGWLAYDLGDTEITWAASMALIGLPIGWNYGTSGILIGLLFMSGVGWFTGFARDANLS
ncbi:hypothetical protein Poly30_02770 [Planctomycetes bacterium Poly30]|uniref:Uncharacterized protein n=1 Tax=Saltatorellus ferox TaxID=2528018 RepID=A0A518EL10_9BACT|nr:hypothetical protein Poly30_02770 [Planctomycetes bacterium Poly30]